MNPFVFHAEQFNHEDHIHGIGDGVTEHRNGNGSSFMAFHVDPRRLDLDRANGDGRGDGKGEGEGWS